MVSKRNETCAKGMIKRKGYTAKRGSKTVKVPASCIKATSYRGVKRAPTDRKIINKRKRIQTKVAKKYSKPKCSTNEMERAGFTRQSYRRKAYQRKDGTFVKAANVRPSEVPPVCINDRGTAGKGYKIPVVLEKGDLTSVGYVDIKNLPQDKRHVALSKANDRISNPLSLFRKLIILSTMNKNTDPKLSQIFRNDAYWVREKFGLMKTKSNTKSNSRTSTAKKSATTKKYGGSKTNRKTTNRKTTNRKTTNRKTTSRSKTNKK